MVNAIPLPVRRLMHVLGIDRAVAYSLMTQGWSLLSQPITMLLTVMFLTSTEIGYQSTFGAIIAVQMFFDLGLGVVTLQFMSHEAAHLQWAPDGTLVGDSTAKSRLASLARLSATWYGIIASSLFFVLLPVGWVFISIYGAPGVAWKLPWSWTVLVATAGALTTAPFMLMSACGRVADMTRLSAIQRFATSLTQWLLLAAGAGLLNWPAAQTVGYLILGVCIARQGWPAIRDLARLPVSGPRVSWWREVWPMQWRIALGTPLAYLIAYMFIPVLFAGDPTNIEAGKMGMSINVMNVLISATIAWVGVRMPVFGHLIARRQWAALDHLFGRVFLISTLLSIGLAVLAFAVLITLQKLGYRLGLQVLPPLPLALLLANGVVQHVVHAMSSYLRAHKRDPFFPLFIAFALSMGVAVFTVGRSFGPVGLAAALVTLNATICLGGGIIIFFRCRREWHVEPSAT